MPLAAFLGLRKTTSPTPHFVSDVVGIRAQVEMRHAHAGWVVAAMENVQAIRDRSELQRPRYAMRKRHMEAITQHPIPRFIAKSCPEVAFIITPSLDLRGETLGEALR